MCLSESKKATSKCGDSNIQDIVNLKNLGGAFKEYSGKYFVGLPCLVIKMPEDSVGFSPREMTDVATGKASATRKRIWLNFFESVSSEVLQSVAHARHPTHSFSLSVFLSSSQIYLHSRAYDEVWRISCND